MYVCIIYVLPPSGFQAYAVCMLYVCVCIYISMYVGIIYVLPPTGLQARAVCMLYVCVCIYKYVCMYNICTYDLPAYTVCRCVYMCMHVCVYILYALRHPSLC
jgi:hypothetical protein